jgi:hypothetical protein
MQISIQSRLSKCLFLVLSLLVVSACSDTADTPTDTVNGNFQAVITGVSFDFGSSEISLANTIVVDDGETADIDESETSYDIVNGFAAQDLSDIRAVTYGQSFYRLGRSSQDNITKYSFDNPSLAEWQFSVNSESETGSNPHDLVFLSETKAYVIKYGSSSVLVINPSVASDDEENFKLGEIDLSAYDVDGIPNMHRAVLHEGILYVVVQSLDSSYIPREAYLVAIDTLTDTEINIGSSVLNGLALNVRNPVDLDLLGSDLYISAIGRYGSAYSTPPREPEFTGGIEKVSLINYSSQLLVDDGNATTHPYGQINGLTLVSDSLAYFIGYNAWKDSSLYQFNPSTGVVVDEVITGFDSVDIRVLETSPEGELWVGIGDDVTPKIQVLNSTDNSEKTTIYTNKNPSAIAFSEDLTEG